jgi:perosamine synthetase
MHAAIAATDPEPGDEIITSPITDVGAVTPILYQGAIPVFADVDPATLSVTATTIAQRISERTRAIIVTHLFGHPVDMQPILDLAQRHAIPVIEDCAQAFLARTRHRLVGTLGTIGCFSLHQCQHITSGEGGLVVTDDRRLAQRIERFINKACSDDGHASDPQFLALNGRMSELQAAVALAQLDKLEHHVARRIDAAARLTDRLSGLRGLLLPKVKEGDTHTFWQYAMHVDDRVVDGGATALAGRLGDLGVPPTAHSMRTPAFDWPVIREQRTFGRSRYPFTLARPEALDYSRRRFPALHAGLRSVLALPLNERLERHHVDHIADAVIFAMGR